jgi:enoyl-[acyl-carrier-protein] reductase (NADH)
VCSSVQNELKKEDGQGFKNYMHISAYDFENLLKMVAPLVKSQDTNFKKLFLQQNSLP